MFVAVFCVWVIVSEYKPVESLMPKHNSKIHGSGIRPNKGWQMMKEEKKKTQIHTARNRKIWCGAHRKTFIYFILPLCAHLMHELFISCTILFRDGASRCGLSSAATIDSVQEEGITRTMMMMTMTMKKKM